MKNLFTTILILFMGSQLLTEPLFGQKRDVKCPCELANTNSILLTNVNDAYCNFNNLVFGSDNLNSKAKELIALSNSVIIDCKELIDEYYKRSINIGISQAEISEVIAVTMSNASGKVWVTSNEISRPNDSTDILCKRAYDAYSDFSRVVYTPKYLDPKLMELIAMTNALIVNCNHCFKVHYEGAIKKGVTKNEISDAIAITMSIISSKIMINAEKIISENK